MAITAAAGTGIGYAAAKRCLEEGASVLISDIHEQRLAESVERLEASTGIRPAATLCDVRVQTEVDALFETARAALGAVDVVINNAGLGGTANLVDVTDEQRAEVLDVTLNGTFRMTRRVLESQEAYGRSTEVWEVANVMVFLASDYSSYMTGETVSVSSQRA